MGKTPGEIGGYDRDRGPDAHGISVTHVDVRAVPQRPQEPEQLRMGIEQTRAEMSETIDAIQERLTPQHLKQQTKETVREQFQGAKDRVYGATIGGAEQLAKGAGTSMMDRKPSSKV